MHIRVLTPSDLLAMRGMLGLFAEVFGEPETYLSAQPGDEYLHALLARDTFIAIAALADSRVIGGLAAYELPKFEQARSEIYIYDLGVDEAFRRRGVATALIEALREVARQRNAWVIYVQADDGDEPAIALYNKLGVEERVLHYDIQP